MCTVVNLDHLFHRNLRVDLGRREPGVAEQFLDVAEVGTVIEQVRRECMPQAVRRDVVDSTHMLDVFVDHTADGAGRDPCALIVEKQSLRVAGRHRTIIKKSIAGLLDIQHHGLCSRFAERHDPLFPPFAGDANHSLAKIDIVDIDARQFTHADAGRVQKLENRPVAAAEIGVDVRRLDKPDGVLDRKMVGQFAFDLRRSDQLGRVGFELCPRG